MSRTRGFFKTYDQRTGRKIRGIDAVYDGEVPSLLVKRGEDDPPHPLSKPFTPGIDRVMLLNARADTGNYTTVLRIGQEANTNLWQRDGIPSLRLWTGDATTTITEEQFGVLDRAGDFVLDRAGNTILAEGH